MKKLLFTIVTISVLFISCTNNDEENITNTAEENSIAGKWSLIDFKSEGTTTNTANGFSASTNFSAIGKDYNFTFDFQNNPNEVEASGSYTSVITQDLAGQSITQEIPTNSVEGLNSGTWSVVNGKLRIVSENTNQETVVTEGEIISLEDQIMKLKFVVDERIEQTIQGIQSVIEVKTDVYLTLEQTESYSDNDSDNSQNYTEEDLIGKWELISFASTGKTTTVTQNQTTEVEYTSSGRDYNFEIEFKTNPQELDSSGEYTEVKVSTTVGVNNSEETDTYTIHGGDTLSWSLQGNTIVVNDTTPNQNTESDILKILNLSDDELKLEVNIDFSYDDGISSDTTKEKRILTFRKK